MKTVVGVPDCGGGDDGAPSSVVVGPSPIGVVVDDDEPPLPLLEHALAAPDNTTTNKSVRASVFTRSFNQWGVTEESPIQTTPQDDFATITPQCLDQ